MVEISHLKEENEQKSYKYRTSLPASPISRNDVSVWSFLKNFIGKDLSTLSIPVVLNEPLSFLQRITEYTEYIHLLNIASEQEDPIDRMKYVAGFAVAALSSTWGRVGKPFSPILGETFELHKPGYRIVCEQVSNKPAVSAFYADSADFIFHGSIRPKIKFMGKYIETKPKGTVTVELPKWGEAYTWSNINCLVHNIVVGKIWVEQKGIMEVVNQKLGLRAVLTFKAGSRTSKDLYKIEGFILDKNEKQLNFIYGKWSEFISCTDINSYEEYLKNNSKNSKRAECSDGARETSLDMNSLSVQDINLDDDFTDRSNGEILESDSINFMEIPKSSIIWKANPRPSNSFEFYQFTFFALSLNEILPEMEALDALCPTDSRLRPDIRKLEQGDIDGAAQEKIRLEEKQRQAKKVRKSKKEEYTPRWFAFGTNPHTKQDDWMYTGGYWDRKYEVTDIF